MSLSKFDMNSETRPRIALVLGTGGIKALAGFSFFDFLSEYKIPVDLMVGCSGGALAVAAIGAGWKPDDARDEFFKRFNKQIFSQLDYRSILGILSSRLGNFDKTTGILKPDRLKQMYHDFFGDLRIEQLSPRTLIQTTDVTTGEGVVLTKGLVADAVYASCAFFPAFPPIKIDGRYLGDGIYSAPVPVMEATKRNIDVVIALDFKEKVTSEPKGFFGSFYRHIDNTMRTLTRSQMFMSIEMHHHEIVMVEVNFDHSINPWDLNEAQFIIEAGQKAVEDNKAMILTALDTLQKRMTGLLQQNIVPPVQVVQTAPVVQPAEPPVQPVPPVQTAPVAPPAPPVPPASTAPEHQKPAPPERRGESQFEKNPRQTAILRDDKDTGS